MTPDLPPIEYEFSHQDRDRIAKAALWLESRRRALEAERAKAAPTEDLMDSVPLKAAEEV